jgi:sulfofructose kinase
MNPDLPGRIAFVGHAVWDHSFRVPQLLSSPGKFVAEAYFCRPGGMSANAALAAQRARGPHSPTVLLAAPLGDDEAGAALCQALDAAGVQLQPDCVLSGHRTSVSAVLIDAAGERQGHNVRGTAQAAAPLPQAGWFSGVRALQVDPRWPDGARAALALARAAGAVSMLDGDVAPPVVLQDLAPRADWVVFSSDGLRAWAGAQAGRDVASLFAQACAALPDTWLAVTCGADGLLWRPPGGTVVARPAVPVPVVNTNGAGDALHGALLLALAEGQPPEAALRFGLAAAACAVAGEDWHRDTLLARLPAP